MSLWMNKDDAKSMPTWYARHCLFKGEWVKEGKLALVDANTQFADGDCVIYFSNSPLAGLTDGNTYYLKRGEGFMYEVKATPEGEAIALTAAPETEHLFIKYDTKETTEDGTIRPALFAVDQALAAKRISGMVSPGWYRYFKYTSVKKGEEKVDRIRLELLVSMKGFDLTKKADITEGDVNTPDEDVVIISDKPVEGVKKVKAKSIKCEDLKVESGRLDFAAEGKVDVKGLHTTGDLPKATSNAAFSINTNDEVIIKSSDIEQTSYNVIEIGLSNKHAPSKVVIEGVNFASKLSNNAILVFAHKENAEILVKDCVFADCSNALRISNRLNVPANIVLENCQFKKWDERVMWTGAVIFEDYTSKTPEDCRKANRFHNLTVTFRNCTNPHGEKIVAPENLATIMGTKDEHQLAYICNDHETDVDTYGVVAYDPSRYPTFKFE